MSFKKMTAQPYPPRHWALYGLPESGKSTFATQMRSPILSIDADHRFSEVLELVNGDVYSLSESPADNVDSERITTLLKTHMPGSDVATIVVDSLTAIIAPLVVQAILDNEAGRFKNKIAAFRRKAMAMRQLQDSITMWGVDTLWIYHLQEGRDAKAKAVTRRSITETELARLTRSINLQMEVVVNNGTRGMKVAWARRGRSGMTLWDESGRWADMPDRIEAAVYGGLTRADQAAIEQEIPTVFSNTEIALAWGFEQGVFKDVRHAQNAYDKLKREHKPQNAQEMAALWTVNVLSRRRSPE